MVTEHAGIEEDNLGELHLSRKANHMKRHLRLLQDYERDEQARFAMATLIPKDAYPYVPYNKACLRQLLNCAINKVGDTFIPGT